MRMIDESLQNEAALYAAGALTPAQREHFELMLIFHDELRELVRGFEEGAVAFALSEVPTAGPQPAASVKARVLQAIATVPQQTQAEALVVTGPEGLVHWINPAFTEMCGYTIDELRNRKLGPLLQGEKTDRAAAERMRDAVHAARPCVEKLINYHKNGEPYWVEIRITPIFSLEGELRWMIGQEREVAAAA
ncbi:MAG TPA: PAS domain-containing protein [Chthoniobacteraceae bacterium]|jgi:PAS domain S-box-containing protein|nr:Blue-light-activated protein [Chthoniobacter sp.]HEV7868530.1 PAS domain-containing protein [Chthoniobacteraceae bacterium]